MEHWAFAKSAATATNANARIQLEYMLNLDLSMPHLYLHPKEQRWDERSLRLMGTTAWTNRSPIGRFKMFL